MEGELGPDRKNRLHSSQDFWRARMEMWALGINSTFIQPPARGTICTAASGPSIPKSALAPLPVVSPLPLLLLMG